ncbi:thiamine diphosphokinase [Lactovum odontotermitis]
MMKVLIAAGLAENADFKLFNAADFDAVIGVDAGALWALNQGLALDAAVGDFDSIGPEDFRLLSETGTELLKFKPEKDETDLELALALALRKYPEAEITVTGALGGRLDHELTNIYLPITEKFIKFAEQIKLVNSQNYVQYLTTAGEHILPRLEGMKYIGFVKVNAANFSISNAKYPLKVEDNFAEIYASNEFIAETMTVSFTSGCVIVIYSNDKK